VYAKAKGQGRAGQAVALPKLGNTSRQQLAGRPFSGLQYFGLLKGWLCQEQIMLGTHSSAASFHAVLKGSWLPALAG